jgi:hypothetical protein
MFLGTPPIQPSAPPPVYCAECGCEVDPAAWLCAICGRNLHEPDAMTPTRPFATATSKDKRRGKSAVERFFAVLLVVGFVVVFDAVQWQRLHSGNPGHSKASILIVNSIALLFWSWFDGFFHISIYGSDLFQLR